MCTARSPGSSCPCLNGFALVLKTTTAKHFEVGSIRSLTSKEYVFDLCLDENDFQREDTEGKAHDIPDKELAYHTHTADKQP